MPACFIPGIPDEQLCESEREFLLCNDPVSLLKLIPDISDRKIRLLAVACARRIAYLMQSSASREAITAAEAYADERISDEELREYEQAARVASATAVREAHSIWAQGAAAPTARVAWIAVWAASAAEHCCDSINRMAEQGSLEAGLQGNIAMRTAQVAAWARSVHEEIAGNETEEPVTETALFFAFLRELKNTVQRIEKAVQKGVTDCETVQQSLIVRDMVGNPFRLPEFHPDWRTELVMNMAQNAYEHRDFDALPALADVLEDAGCQDTAILHHLRGSEHAIRVVRMLDCTNEEIIAAVSRAVSPHDIAVALQAMAADALPQDRTRILSLIPPLTTVFHVRGCWVLDEILQKN